MKKHFTAHLIFVATALVGQQAWALGFGRSVSDAVLGQPFTFSVPVRMEAGERLAAECVSAKVRYGDTLLPPSAVRTDVLPGDADALTLRVTASVPVSEPIIEVGLDIGCDRRFSRLFSVFADPPTLGATPVQVAPLPQSATAPQPLAASPEAVGTTAHGAARTAPRSASGARARTAHKPAAVAVAKERAAPPAGRPTAADDGGAKKAGPRTPPAGTTSQPAESGVPRLKLDMEEPVVPPPSVVAGASGAAAAPPDQGDDLRQLKALQQGLEAARRDIQAQREQTAALQAQLAHARAQAQSRVDWTPWLLALLAVAAAAIAALVWMLRQQARIAHSDWYNQSALGPATAVPRASELPSELPSEAAAVVTDLHEPAVAAPAGERVPGLAPIPEERARPVPVSDQTATRPFDRQALAAAAPAGAPRELSVEELLDLEQQADFFIALGQEDAAVDLLMSHLRSAGGQSPLPYTKLLEIYRRQGDRTAYERTRARFNRRFNAYAPDWDKGPSAGRSLEDYPETIAQLERTWHSPLDAMAMLESLLFKRDDTSELFDLPAYRDVLVLYSLARDLWQYGGGHGGTHVDVLLPLDDGAGGAAAPAGGRPVNERPQSGHSDAESSEAGDDTRGGLRTSFEMTGFGSGPSSADFDLDRAVPSGGDVHATLDELSLSPAAPTRPKPDPRDWRDGGDARDPEKP